MMDKMNKMDKTDKVDKVDKIDKMDKADSINKTNKDLLKQLTVLDFMATDLHLYLNTHPEDALALKMFNDVTTKSAQVRKEYENHFGPLVSYRSSDIKDGQTPAKWRWEDCPWPWERDFNFKLDDKWGHAPAVHHGEEHL